MRVNLDENVEDEIQKIAEEEDRSATDVANELLADALELEKEVEEEEVEDDDEE